MKHYRRRVIFGIFLIGLFLGMITIMSSADNSAELFYPIIFIAALSGGVIIWMLGLKRESKRRAEENLKRKYR